MKTAKLFILLLISALIANAQTNDKYTTAMLKGVTMIDSAKNSEDYTLAANYFERIADKEKKQWLPQYYAGFCNMHIAMDGNQNSEAQDVLYDKAMAYTDKADLISPDNSEIYVLKGYIVFMKMSVAGQSRAMTMIPRSKQLLEKAITLDPENPRAYLIQGLNTFYTPEMFGGGKGKSKATLMIAAIKFANTKPNGIEPAWGNGLCKSLLKRTE